jgi:hypothetical protein
MENLLTVMIFHPFNRFGSVLAFWKSPHLNFGSVSGNLFFEEFLIKIWLNFNKVFIENKTKRSFQTFEVFFYKMKKKNQN